MLILAILAKSQLEVVGAITTGISILVRVSILEVEEGEVEAMEVAPNQQEVVVAGFIGSRIIVLVSQLQLAPLHQMVV